MKSQFRSKCPISSGLDIIGDKWSLLIIRDMLFSNKKTFKDFSSSEECIATNILTSRLKLLEELKIIRKSKLEGNKKSNIYSLTEKGINLLPLIAEITLWSNEFIRELHPKMIREDYNDLKNHKQDFLKTIKENYLKNIGSL